MAGEADKAKGRVKKAVGELTKDEDLRREGNIDEACDKVEEVTGKVADSTLNKNMEQLFTRYPGNPILTAKDIPYPVKQQNQMGLFRRRSSEKASERARTEADQVFGQPVPLFPRLFLGALSTCPR